MTWTTRDVNVFRHTSYKVAIDDAVLVCDKYIQALEAHKGPDGSVTGQDFNVHEIMAVQAVRDRLIGLRIENDKRFGVSDAAAERQPPTKEA